MLLHVYMCFVRHTKWSIENTISKTSLARVGCIALHYYGRYVPTRPAIRFFDFPANFINLTETTRIFAKRRARCLMMLAPVLLCSFQINETSGEIKTTQSLDREARGEHVFVVKAKDLAIDFRISTVQVCLLFL